MPTDQASRSLWSRFKSFFRSKKPLLILPYRSFANRERIFLKGRVLKNSAIVETTSNSRLRSLLNSFKRFGTREVPDQEVDIQIEDQHFSVTTDREGYFMIDRSWKVTEKTSQNQWIEPLLSIPKASAEEPETTHEAEVLVPSPQTSYGVISDVDDTILQTHVNSLLRLRLLYATFFKHPHQRLPMEGIVELFQQFAGGRSGKENNPFFYVSNSPWNLYDLLEQFMDIQQLPKGPILLRDYGIKPAGPFSDHKMEAISRILEMYPDIPFLLFGDTASKDADHYLELADQFPGQVKAIYIRFTKNTRNARRVRQLIEDQKDENIRIIHSSEEIAQHARQMGLI
ncbi:MAG TPA: phosphatase domain-containing protein [Saprospiraceae bacterium]|nr:phosphatase domain-containing protein [Saprospiraceae bacterium]